MDELNTGVGALPDSSASAGTPETVVAAPPVENASPVEEKTISEDTASVPPTTEEEGDAVGDINSEIESAIKEEASDSDLVKKLRGLLKTKFESNKKGEEPQLSESQQQALELVEGLFEFDFNTQSPTTRKFAENLAKKDLGLAQQAFQDLSSIPVDENGFTIGHKFLEMIGLDPYKIEDLRKFSKGEINPTSLGMVKVHSAVPKELTEAYKSLSPINRTDVDVYLDSEDDVKISAALQVLRNQQVALNSERREAEMVQRQQESFNTEVYQATETDLNTTYTGIIEALKTNPAYTNVTISSDKTIDSMVKDTLISNLNALGDPRSLLAQTAAKNFEARGVQVDLKQIGDLMEAIEVSARTAIAAERMGKLQGRDYSSQVQEALGRKSNAVAKLLALGNRYFSQALANMTGASNPAPKPGIPGVEGNAPQGTASVPGKAKTFAELDAEIMNIAGSLAAAK